MSDFLEEVRSIFSYLNDDYDMSISAGQIFQMSKDSVYIRIYHDFSIKVNGTDAGVNDISDLLKSSKKITNLLDSVEDCMLKLSINDNLYHNTSMEGIMTPKIIITLSRSYFGAASRMDKKV